MKLIVTLVLSLTASGAAARGPDIAAQIDAYLRAPRSANIYRALANLGDPTFGASEEPFAGWDQDAIFVGDRLGGACRTGYAHRVWNQRKAELGENHPYAQRWLATQRAVFASCAGWNDEERRPQPLPPPLPLADERIRRMQAADRAYQSAAKLFYDQRLAAARIAFAALASEPGPHRDAAKLMVASIAAGSRPGWNSVPNPKALPAAEALLSGAPTSSGKLDAQQLVGWLGATADTPATRAAQIKVTADALHLPIALLRSDAGALARYRQALEDLPKLSSNFDNKDWWLTGAIPAEYHGSRAVAARTKTDPLVAFTLVPPACRKLECPSVGTVPKWIDERSEAPDSDAWRVAKLGRAYNSEASWTELDQLIARVTASPNDHDVALLAMLTDDKVRGAFAGRKYDPAEAAADRQAAADLLSRWPWPDGGLLDALYNQALQDLASAGRIAEARRLRDRIEPRLGKDHGYGPEGELQLLLAQNEAELVAAMNSYGTVASPLLDRMPVAGLERLARQPSLKVPDRARFARVAWVRSYVSQKRMPTALDTLMRQLNPELTANWTSKRGAKTEDHRLLLDVFRSPGLNLRLEARTATSEEESKPNELDLYQHSLTNWWCGGRPAEQGEREESALAGAAGDSPRPGLEPLLHESWLWQQLNARERALVAKTPMAPRLLAEKAVRWGTKANPNDPKGADEALALAVRATRYGCQMQGSHGPWSKAAYDLLHLRFPDTVAAIRTRWWFDCKHFTYGCTESGKDDYGFSTGVEGSSIKGTQMMRDDQTAAGVQR